MSALRLSRQGQPTVLIGGQEPVVTLPTLVIEVSRRWRERFHGPLAGITAKGMLHRVQPDGGLHPRCRGGRVVTYRVLTAEEALELGRATPRRFCRYAWCFRDAVEAAGIDPWVGHAPRVKRPIA